MKGLLLSIQLLTRIPIRIRGNVSAKDLSRSTAFFPVVGLVQGMFAACGALVFSLVFTPEISSGLVILILVLTNGGFHLDGLADTADALSVKSTGDPSADLAKRLTVMKDSSTGAIGVVAIVLDILLKYLFINSFLEKSTTWETLFFLILMPVFSKWVMVPTICHGKSARDDGLGKVFMDNMDTSTLLVSIIMLAAIFGLASFALPDRTWAGTIKLFFYLVIPLYGLSLVWVAFCRRQFNGLTGDNMGAISEVAEILYLAIAFSWL